jgi:hypothetical protein
MIRKLSVIRGLFFYERDEMQNAAIPIAIGNRVTQDAQSSTEGTRKVGGSIVPCYASKFLQYLNV